MGSSPGVDVVVHFREKADLSKAPSLTWGMRGQMVFQSLKATAETSQTRALKLLNSAKGAYKSYGSHFSTNVLCIKGLKDARLLEEMAALPEVAQIFEAPVHSVCETRLLPPRGGLGNGVFDLHFFQTEE